MEHFAEVPRWNTNVHSYTTIGPGSAPVQRSIDVEHLSEARPDLASNARRPSKMHGFSRAGRGLPRTFRAPATDLGCALVERRESYGLFQN